MLMEERKRCSGCGADKPLSRFYANARGRYGRHSLCKGCMDARRSESLAAILSSGELTVPAKKTCPMCHQSLPAAGFSSHKSSWDGLRTYCRGCDKVVRRSGKYGLPRGRVADMLTQSECEACGNVFKSDADKHIDHRHSDGAVRGILCQRCNTTIGQCGENERILLRLCEYLSRTRAVDYRTQPYLEQNVDSSATSHAESFSPEGNADTCQTNTTNHQISPQP